jgi:glycerol-3-phosphate dehydrogenase
MMTKNKLADLNDHLFAQLERLSDEAMSAEDIEKEVARATAMVEVADRITENAKLTLSAAKLFAEHGAQVLPYLPQIGKSPS